jgi:hypothetical protein
LSKLRDKIAQPLLCLAAVMLAAGSAHAQTTPGITYNPNSAPALTVTVTAKVTAACGFATAPNGTQDVGDVRAAYEYSFPFEIRCSLPSRVGVQSANGGLLAIGAANFPAAGYSALAPYQVQLNLAGDAVSASQTCDANTLSASAASPCSARGPATTTSGLVLAGPSLAADPPDSVLRVFSLGYAGADQMIAATNYADTLTVTISPNS